MTMVLTFKCKNCNKTFGVDVETNPNIELAPDFEKKLFEENSILPLGTQTTFIHACDDHTVGPAEFIYGKKVPEQPGLKEED